MHTSLAEVGENEFAYIHRLRTRRFRAFASSILLCAANTSLTDKKMALVTGPSSRNM